MVAADDDTGARGCAVHFDGRVPEAAGRGRFSWEAILDDDIAIAPSGRMYRLAAEALPALERAHANRSIVRDYLLDIVATVQASAPAAVFPMRLVETLGETIRTLPVPWLREFAYAGMLAVLQSLEDDQTSGE